VDLHLPRHGKAAVTFGPPQYNAHAQSLSLCRRRSAHPLIENLSLLWSDHKKRHSGSVRHGSSAAMLDGKTSIIYMNN
jgi:hypothetical protein